MNAGLLHRPAVTAALLGLFVACGGRSAVVSGGSTTGGLPSSGGTSGSGGGGTASEIGGVGGTVGSSVGGTGTCLAAPVCAPNEFEIPGPEDCLEGAVCHEVSICGSTIWCSEEASCNAIPSCDAEDTELDGTCPPDGRCYARSACGVTIYCFDRCNPATEPNRQYLWGSCNEGVGWVCAFANTTPFLNECGCGCEQDASCPPYFNCSPPANSSGSAGAGAPGASPPPQCDPGELMRCPFSEVRQ